MLIRTFCLLSGAAALAFSGCLPDRLRSGGRWIDLTHAFSGDTLYWPTSEPFKKETVFEGIAKGGYYYSAYKISTAEHGGTHIDAPVHFAKGRAAVDQIPLERLLGEAAVIDVSAQASAQRDYQAAAGDFAAWEARHGPIPAGAIVLLRTGWGKRWPDPVKYLGTSKRGEEGAAELHFPGLHPDAARWLIQYRRIGAIGIDTPSIDHGPSKDFQSHRLLFESEIPAFENVASLELLPETGAFVIALPMKIQGGSGGPLRIIARVP